MTPSTHYDDQRVSEREHQISEEYQIEIEQQNSNRRSPHHQRQSSPFGVQRREGSSEDDMSDAYGRQGDNSYSGLTAIITEAGQRRSSATRDPDWRTKLKQVYSATADEDQFEQVNSNVDNAPPPPSSFHRPRDKPFTRPIPSPISQSAKRTSGRYTAQFVSVIPSHQCQPRIEDVPLKGASLRSVLKEIRRLRASRSVARETDPLDLV